MCHFSQVTIHTSYQFGEMSYFQHLGLVLEWEDSQPSQLLSYVMHCQFVRQHFLKFPRPCSAPEKIPANLFQLIKSGSGR